jgi:flagellar motor switch/type III secretory pathway protein FliN
MSAFDRVKLPTSVILERRSLGPGDLARLQTSADLAIDDPWRRELELEVGGAVVARGRLVRRGGRTWFKVTAVAGEEQP